MITKDIFIYFFSDNIDETKGIIEEDENVIFFDEKDILRKYRAIQSQIERGSVSYFNAIFWGNDLFLLKHFQYYYSVMVFFVSFIDT